MSEASSDENYEPMNFEEAVEFMTQPESSEVHMTLRMALERTPAILKTQDESGNSLLHHAAFNGRLTCCLAFLEVGAHPGLRNKDGENPGHIATALSYSEIASAVYDAMEKVRPADAWCF